MQHIAAPAVQAAPNHTTSSGQPTSSPKASSSTPNHLHAPPPTPATAKPVSSYHPPTPVVPNDAARAYRSTTPPYPSLGRGAAKPAKLATPAASGGTRGEGSSGTTIPSEHGGFGRAFENRTDKGTTLNMQGAHGMHGQGPGMRELPRTSARPQPIPSPHPIAALATPNPPPGAAPSTSATPTSATQPTTRDHRPQVSPSHQTSQLPRAAGSATSMRTPAELHTRPGQAGQMGLNASPHPRDLQSSGGHRAYQDHSGGPHRSLDGTGQSGRSSAPLGSDQRHSRSPVHAQDSRQTAHVQNDEHARRHSKDGRDGRYHQPYAYPQNSSSSRSYFAHQSPFGHRGTLYDQPLLANSSPSGASQPHYTSVGGAGAASGELRSSGVRSDVNGHSPNHVSHSHRSGSSTTAPARSNRPVDPLFGAATYTPYVDGHTSSVHLDNVSASLSKPAVDCRSTKTPATGRSKAQNDSLTLKDSEALENGGSSTAKDQEPGVDGDIDMGHGSLPNGDGGGDPAVANPSTPEAGEKKEKGKSKKVARDRDGLARDAAEGFEQRRSLRGEAAREGAESNHVAGVSASGKGVKVGNASKIGTGPGGVQRKKRKGDLDSVNQDFCSSCRGIGRFLCCDGCPRSFHFMCLEPPLRVDELPEEETWYCKKCKQDRRESNASSPVKEQQTTSVVSPSHNQQLNPIFTTFKMLWRKLDEENPSQFRLPNEVRQYFAGVGSDARGNYMDADEVRIKYDKKGFQEERDPNKLKDSKSRLVACYVCGGSAFPLRQLATDPESVWRPIVSCDYCALHWHLDCLAPPLASMPNSGRKWMCPNHAEQVMARKRIVKQGMEIVDVEDRNAPNNGNIDIVPNEETKLQQMQYEDLMVNKRKYRVPERIIQLDFWDRLKLGLGIAPAKRKAKRSGSESSLTSLESDDEPTKADLDAANLIMGLATFAPSSKPVTKPVEPNDKMDIDQDANAKSTLPGAPIPAASMGATPSTALSELNGRPVTPVSTLPKIKLHFGAGSAVNGRT